MVKNEVCSTINNSEANVTSRRVDEQNLIKKD